MDIDTRLLRYFAAVAEEGNLTRAAERLFVSQPALTKQIRQLERQLGVPLFTRSRAGMTLTAAGRALAGQVPAVLGGLDQALREPKAAASRAARVLRVGFLAGAANEATQQIIAEFGRRRAGRPLDGPHAVLASGDVDAALLRLPFPGQDSLRTEVLFTEPRWVALPAAHPLATRDVIGFRELWDEPFVAARLRPTGGATGGWPSASARVTRSGSEPSPRPASPTTGSPPSPTAKASPWPPRPPPATTHAPASPTGPSQASAPARSAPPGRPPPTPAPSSRTSSAAAGTTPLAQGDG